MNQLKEQENDGEREEGKKMAMSERVSSVELNSLPSLDLAKIRLFECATRFSLAWLGLLYKY